MPQSLAQIYVHLVFSTKERRRWLDTDELRTELYAYMAAILRDNVDSPAVLIGGVEDHVHVLMSMSRKFALMDIVQQAKAETSKWIKRSKGSGDNFAWQAGYGAFSVSASQVETVKGYIARQAEHHHRQSFQDEFRVLCARHELPLDERYAWD